ncbi:hypothetical protein [Cryptosporangium sp. NPDC048952]|uniref:hypothetical protein n=1 Tax=Cryptosporangium sp. NPDC048952 TaxID=3363961 RepID=UPI00372367E8
MLIYTATKASGTWFYLRNGAKDNSGKLALTPAPEDYVCTGNKLTVGGSDYSQEFTRVS